MLRGIRCIARSSHYRRGVIDVITKLLAVAFSPRGMRIAVPGLMAFILGCGALFALLEPVDLGDGLYWAFVTVTTVGYGDVVPTTLGAKLVAVALMLGGIGFLFVLAGAVVEHFVAVEVEEREVLRRIDVLSAQVEELSRQLRDRP
jgi:voltage-gated potassium channel Kch